MNRESQAILILLLLPLALIALTGCNLSDSTKKDIPEPEVEVEEYFKADLNGEPWSRTPSALLMNMDGLPAGSFGFC